MAEIPAVRFAGAIMQPRYAPCSLMRRGTARIYVVACVGILIYINTGSRARDASSGVGGDLQRIKLDDSMDTSNICPKGMVPLLVVHARTTSRARRISPHAM